MNSRLTTKPSRLRTTTGVLRSDRASFKVVANTGSDVAALWRMISTSGIRCAELKKCMPTNRSGCRMPSASRSSEIVDVLVARIASFGQTPSSRVRTARFTATSSNTASMTS